jgi:uncharacterized protein (TIGR02118 family)
MRYVSVMYPNRDGVKFDFDYYLGKHIPMASRLLGSPIEVCKGIATPTGAPPAFLCTARIRVNSMEEFQAAMAQHRAQIMGDIPNYCNLEPTVQIDEVMDTAVDRAA